MGCKLTGFLTAVCLMLQAVCLAAEYNMGITLLEGEQALVASETVLYTNNTGKTLENVMFQVYSNCLRRQTTLPCDNAALVESFPSGYAPSGTEFHSVTVNGKSAEWAIQGENECFLRVACPLEPGQQAEIGFTFTVLLSENRTFLGCGEYDWRLMLFYPAICAWCDGFVTNPLSRGGEWFYSEPSSFRVDIALPKGYDIACGGNVSYSNGIHHIELDNALEIGILASRAFHRKSSGIVTVYGQDRIALASALKTAEKYLGAYETLLGELPCGKLDIVLSETAVTRGTPGLISLASKDIDRLPFYIAEQYFMNSNPAVDPFLRGGLAEYAWLQAVKLADGEKAYRRAISDTLLPHLSITIPGGLTPDSYVSRFTTRADYETVVIMRGAAVIRELAAVTGDERMIEALKEFSAAGTAGGAGIEEFVACLDRQAGKSMGEALVAWLYTIDEYSASVPDYYD